jgi:phage shock protein A
VSFLLSIGDTKMTQAERLEKDVKDLEHYALRLKKKGKVDLAKKILIKKEYALAYLNGENSMKFAS